MNVRAIVTSLPLLRRAWRFLPGPLRIPLLAVGGGIYLWSRMTGREPPTDHDDQRADDSAPAG